MEIIYLVALHWIGITHKKFHIIFENKQNYKEVFENISSSFLEKNKFSSSQIENILNRYKKVDLNLLEKKLKSREVKLITFFDSEYPDNLKEIPNKPFLFYLRGKIDNSPAISVVGARNISPYGLKVIEEIIPELSRSFTIVSGGAAGCDTKAHKETLKAENPTIAVLGTGIDLDYPVPNKTMYDKIAANSGGVISIFPIGEVGNSYNFPVRNEIVAGLSLGTLIVEAKEKSGSLITAKLALDLGKDLFAIPGSIFNSLSKGCNDLIANGEAKIIRNINDILVEYGKKRVPKKIDISFNDKLEEEIYKNLIDNPLSIDELVKLNNIDISSLNLKLSMMELGGLINKQEGGKYMAKN